MPGQVTGPGAGRRVRWGRIGCFVILLWMAGFWAMMIPQLIRAIESNRMDAVLSRAMRAHVPKGTRLPVTLWRGQRILRIDSAFVEYPPTGPGHYFTLPIPTSCVFYSVLDPSTGATDLLYRSGAATCVKGVAYKIP